MTSTQFIVTTMLQQPREEELFLTLQQQRYKIQLKTIEQREATKQ